MRLGGDDSLSVVQVQAKDGNDNDIDLSVTKDGSVDEAPVREVLVDLDVESK